MTKQQLIEYSYLTLSYYSTYFLFLNKTIDIANIINNRIFKIHNSNRNLKYLNDIFIKRIIHIATVKLLAREYIDNMYFDYLPIIAEVETTIFKEEIKELSKGYNKYA